MSGIVCAGHWVLDHIKFIDNWPDRSEICTILSESISHGGAPFNVIVDIANLKVNIPITGVGCIGDDLRGKKVLEICREKQISIDFLHVLKGESTGYTDVMSLRSIGERTMFHYHGANDLFSLEHVPIEQLKQKGFRFFYLGHLLLMATLEVKDSKFGLKAKRLLHDVKKAGMETVLDIATEHDLDRYQKIVIPCLPYVDHLVIDELEAQKMSGIKIRQKKGSFKKGHLKRAADFLLDKGINKNVIIHMPEGAYWASKQKTDLWYPSFSVPKKLIASACGAGDAFCGGIMIGLHEGWNMEKTMQLAHATAAMTLTCWHNSEGIKPIKETLSFTKKWKKKIKKD